MSTANAQIKAIVERIERLDEEAEALSNDKRDIYAEAKGNGFDVPALKTVIQRRRKRRRDPNKYEETESIVETYEAALASGTVSATRAGAQGQSFENFEQLASAPEKPADAIEPAAATASHPEPNAVASVQQRANQILAKDDWAVVDGIRAPDDLTIPSDGSIPPFLDRRPKQEALS